MTRKVLNKSGERGGNRTYNLLIKSQLLCQLSYAPPSHHSSIAEIRLSLMIFIPNADPHPCYSGGRHHVRKRTT